MAHIPADLLALGKIESAQCDVSVATREHLATALHTHPSNNHVLVTEGRLFLTLEGREQIVHAGEWCYIPAHAEHAERFEEKTSVVVFWLKQ